MTKGKKGRGGREGEREKAIGREWREMGMG